MCANGSHVHVQRRSGRRLVGLEVGDQGIDADLSDHVHVRIVDFVEKSAGGVGASTEIYQTAVISAALQMRLLIVTGQRLIAGAAEAMVVDRPVLFDIP